MHFMGIHQQHWLEVGQQTGKSLSKEFEHVAKYLRVDPRAFPTPDLDVICYRRPQALHFFAGNTNSFPKTTCGNFGCKDGQSHMIPICVRARFR
jgi:hypothetical protein